jgi:hypothetical protein
MRLTTPLPANQQNKNCKQMVKALAGFGCQETLEKFKSSKSTRLSVVFRNFSPLHLLLCASYTAIAHIHTKLRKICTPVQSASCPIDKIIYNTYHVSPTRGRDPFVLWRIIIRLLS